MSLPSLASLSLARTQHRTPAPRSARTGGLAVSRHLIAAEVRAAAAARAKTPASLLALPNLTDRPENEKSPTDETDLTDQAEKLVPYIALIKQLRQLPEDDQSGVILSKMKQDRVAGCLLLQSLLQSGFKPSLTVLQNMVAELDIPKPRELRNAPWEEWMNAVRFFYCQMHGETDPLTRVFIAARLGDVALLKKVMDLHHDDLASLVYSRQFPEDTVYYPGLEREALPNMDPVDALRIYLGFKVRSDFKYLVYAFRIALSYGHFEMMDFVLETLVDRQIDILPLRQNSEMYEDREEQRWRYIDAYEFECAARSQNVKVLEWLDERTIGVVTKQLDIDQASKGLAYNTNRAVAKWFVTRYGVDFSDMKVGIFETAMKAGNVPLMQWLFDNYFADGEVVDRANTGGFERAAGYGHIDVMKWLWNLEGFDRQPYGFEWIGALNAIADHARPEALKFAFETFDEAYHLTQLDVREIVERHKRRVQTYVDDVRAVFASAEVDYHSFLKLGERSKAEIIADAEACTAWLEEKLHEPAYTERKPGEPILDEDGSVIIAEWNGEFLVAAE